MTGETARAEDEAAGQPETSAAATGAAAAGEPKPSTSLDREHAEMKDRLLRTLAEMENLRKRTEREVTDARLYGVASFARDVLGVADNIRRALDAVPPEARAHANAGMKALVDGVELTERELLKALEVPDPSVPAGSIVQVMQPGYMIGERVLRPALVAVAKGGPKAAPNSASGNDNRAAVQDS
jgi:molecular chaperone GrpE